MHELGVVFHIADQVVKIAEENQASRVARVTLMIGEVSTVIPDYLIDVWNWNCKRTPMLEDCQLLWEPIHAVTYCENCGKTYDTVPQGKICPPHSAAAHRCCPGWLSSNWPLLGRRHHRQCYN